MTVDVVSLVVFTGVMAALALLKCFVARMSGSADASVGYLAGSNLALMIASAGLVLRPEIGFVASSGMVVAGTYFAIAFGYMAIARALGLPPYVTALSLLGCGAVAAQTVMATYIDSIDPLLASSSVINGTLALAMAVRVAISARGFGLVLDFFLTLSFAALAIAYLLRLGFVLLDPDGPGVAVMTAVIVVLFAGSALKWIFGLVALRRAQLGLLLQHERNRAEALSRAKSDFLRSMSHELRTPLNAVIGLSQIMQSRAHGRDLAAYQRHVDQIQRSGHYLLELITDLLDLSRIESGRLEIAEEPVDLGAVTEAVIAMLSPHMEEKSIVVLRDVPEEARLLTGDRRRITQVTLNLVSNAVKYTPEGGTVRVSTRLAEGALELRVSDNGPGMDAAALESALELFGRAGLERGDLVEGTGVGLPLSRELMEAHGGTLTLESSPGQGTLARARFPASRRLEAEMVAAS